MFWFLSRFLLGEMSRYETEGALLRLGEMALRVTPPPRRLGTSAVQRAEGGTRKGLRLMVCREDDDDHQTVVYVLVSLPVPPGGDGPRNEGQRGLFE
jgi:hypothetical protein